MRHAAAVINPAIPPPATSTLGKFFPLVSALDAAQRTARVALRARPEPKPTETHGDVDCPRSARVFCRASRVARVALALANITGDAVIIGRARTAA
jgi:hypothetical protein